MTRYQELRKAGMCTRDCGRKGAAGPKGPRSECSKCRENSHGSGKSSKQRPSKGKRRKVMTGGKSAQNVASILQGCSDIDFVGLTGWPDLFIIRKNGTSGFVEVKDRDKLSQEQKRCHEAFAAKGIVVEVITPAMAKSLYNGKPPSVLTTKKPSTRALAGETEHALLRAGQA